MPAAPLYAQRLPDAIATLSARTDDWIDRRTFEQILGMSKWTAWRIFKRCGDVDGPGTSLVTRRVDLVRHLQALCEGQLAPELARRTRLEKNLDEILQFASRKRTYFARHEAARDILSSRFSRLPPGVDLEPREVRIQFEDPQEFLEKFGAVVFALQNDYEQIAEFIAAGPK
jgi:hypothetical protein